MILTRLKTSFLRFFKEKSNQLFKNDIYEKPFSESMGCLVSLLERSKNNLTPQREMIHSSGLTTMPYQRNMKIQNKVVLCGSL